MAERTLRRVGDPAPLHADWLQRMHASTATILTAWNPLGEAVSCVFDLPDVLLDEWLTTFRQNAGVQVTRRAGCRRVWHPSIRAGTTG